jgi:hypothetical protein
MDTEDAEIARDLMDCERTGRGLGIDEKFATIGVDQFARDAGRLLRLSLGIADHHLDLPAGQSARGVDFFNLNRHRVARRSSKLCDTT